VAPRLPVRDLEGLQQSYDGMTGGALAQQLIKRASRGSAGVGAITGGLATAGQLAPPLWFTLPVEIAAETLLVAAIEMRLIAELHTVYGMPIEGTQEERAVAIVEAWTQRHGVDVKQLAKKGPSEIMEGHGVSKSLMRLVQRKLMGRAVRNIGTLAPLFTGAAIGAETNRRSTRDVGNAVAHDLARRKKVAAT
jgi:hypothetical protein